MLKKYYLFLGFIAFIICFLALLIRVQPFLQRDFYFLLDQSRDMMLVKDIIVSHKLPLIGARAGFGGLFHGPLWLYMIIPFYLASHGNPFFSLVPLFVLVSLSIVVAGFFIGKKLYGFTFGILFALILAAASPLIDSVPFTTNAEVMPLVFLLFLYFAIEFLRGKNNFFIGMCFAAGISLHFESAFGIFLIPLILIVILLRWKKLNTHVVILGIGAFLISISNFIFFELRHRFLMTHAVLSLFFHHQEPIKGFERYSNILFRVQDRVNLLKDSFFLQILNENSILKIAIVLFVIAGLILFIKKWVVKRKLDKEYLFIFLIPFLIYSVYIFYPFPLWSHYTIAVSIFSALLLALSLKNVLEVIYGKTVVILFAVFIFIQAGSWVLPQYTNLLDQQKYTSSSDGSYKNQLAVAQWIFQDAGTTPFGYFVYNPQVLTYNMDYLLWFEGNNHAVSFSNQKHAITYLVMYAGDPKDLQAHDYWKQHVVRTKGVVLNHVVLAGNITIEKLRIADFEEPADPNYYQNLLFR